MFALDISNLFFSVFSNRGCFFTKCFETDCLFCGLPETFPIEEKQDSHFITVNTCYIHEKPGRTSYIKKLEELSILLRIAWRTHTHLLAVTIPFPWNS